MQPLNTPLRFNFPSSSSVVAKRQMVQHAEIDLIVVTLSKIRHSELAVFTMAEEAHISVQHDPLLLAPVRLKEAIVALDADTIFANWEAPELWL